VGTFRAYIRGYLRRHAAIHDNMTLLVRQLNPTPQGLPIEIYCFTNTTDWGAYEDIQSDLLDHLLALAPDFGLQTFQNPSGRDLMGLRQQPR
jgi:miniconductance mechanosensitive channel